MIGKALIKNLKHCRDLIDEGYNVIFVYPFSSRELPKHIKNIIVTNDIFNMLEVESFFDNYQNLNNVYKFKDKGYFAFKPENHNWFRRYKSHYPISKSKKKIIYVRFDFSPDLHLANEIIDS